MNDHVTHPGGIGRLGRATISRIGYGAMQLERLSDDREAAVRVIRRALDLGIDHLDTSQYYADGFVNSAIGEAVGPDRPITIATKIGADPASGGPFPMRAAQRPEELRASVHQNLRTLGRESIPLVNLRRMEVGPGIALSDDQRVDLDDQLAEMTAMRDEGLIGGIGLSSVTVDSLRRAIPVGLDCVQNGYSLVDRGDEPLLELCVEEGIAWVPYFPLGSAFPGMPKVTDEDAVRTAAAALDVTPAQVGLAWLLQHTANTLLIPGTSSVEHLEANVAVGDVHLTPSIVEQLDRIPQQTPDGAAS